MDAPLAFKKVFASFLLVVLISLIYGYFRYELLTPWGGLFAAAIVGIAGRYIIELKVK